jgi:hypothetical protein
MLHVLAECERHHVYMLYKCFTYFHKPYFEPFGSKRVAFYEDEVSCFHNEIFGSECVSHNIDKIV